MALLRRRTLPDDVRAVVLDRGERVLTWAPLAVGAGTAVATDRALRVVIGSAVETLPWNEMLRAVWEAESSSLVLELAVPPYAARRQHVALEGDGGRLPETVRERVTSSIVVAQHVPLVGRSGVRIVARRIPGSTELLWQLHPDSGIDLQRIELRVIAEDALAELRASLTS